MNHRRVYAMSDIHNDCSSFRSMLEQIRFSKEKDMLYIVGDLFDRGNEPYQLYREVVRLGESVNCIRGNHDHWLALRIYSFLGLGDRTDFPTCYNTFKLLKEQVTETELKEIADFIMLMPLYLEIEVDGKAYQLAHAQTYDNPQEKSEEDFLLGPVDNHYLSLAPLKDGVISVIGHTPTDRVKAFHGIARYNSKQYNEIFCNRSKTTFYIDCGNGYRDEEEGRLGCLCLSNNQEYYI